MQIAVDEEWAAIHVGVRQRLMGRVIVTGDGDLYIFHRRGEALYPNVTLHGDDQAITEDGTVIRWKPQCAKCSRPRRLAGPAKNLIESIS